MEQKNLSYFKKEHNYSLEEKPQHKISPLWQVVQVIFYLGSIICGFAVSYCFGNAEDIMKQNCLLYAKVKFNNETHYNDFIINDTSLVFDYQNYGNCNIVIFIPVIVASFGSFFMVLFIICGRGGAGDKCLPDAWRIIMPSIIFNVVSFGHSIFSVRSFEIGMEVFLQNFSEASKHDKFEITDLSNLYSDGVDVGKRLVYFLILTKYAVRMLVSFCGLNFFWIVLRCVLIVDFQLVRTTTVFYPKLSESEVIIPNPDID